MGEQQGDQQGGYLGPSETACPRARSVLTRAIAGSQEPSDLQWGAGAGFFLSSEFRFLVARVT